MGLPVISVEFKKLASTAVNRSIRGILAVIVQDDTVTSFDYKTYTTLEDVVATDYTDENYTALSRAFLAGPYQVIVVRIGTTKTMDDAKAILDKLSPNWLCAVPEALQSGVASYVKSVNTTRRIRKVKALVTGQEDVDDIRESPTLQMLESMKEHLCGHPVKVYDPWVDRDEVPNQVHSMEEFLEGLEVVIVMVGHSQVKGKPEIFGDRIVVDPRDVMGAGENVCKL